jgi:hypothetical protein
MSSRREFLERAVAFGVLAAMRTARADAVYGQGSAYARVRQATSRGSVGNIKRVLRREDTVRRYAVYGDNWNLTWAADDRQYVSMCDGSSFENPPKQFHNSRMLAISGGPHEAIFHDLPGYPTLAHPQQGKNDARYYNFGTLAAGGYLYQFMSTFNRGFRADELERPDPTDLVRFTGAKLIYSPDNGRTWCNQDGSTPVTWEAWGNRSRQNMVFFEEKQEAFSLLSILQMGRNYEENRDGYVYVYAPNGYTNGTMNELVLFRAPKQRILERQAYEYFAGWGASGRPKWSMDIESRRPVHTFPRGWVNTLMHPYAWHPSVVYNAPLGIYMMANWGMGTASDGMWFGKPSYLGFWVASNPWGPWRQIHEETKWLPAGDQNARAYEPQIAPKWIAADGKSFWLVWTDFQVTDVRARKEAVEEYKRHADDNIYGEDEVIQSASMMRKYMPYYAFNVQRVDLIVG